MINYIFQLFFLIKNDNNDVSIATSKYSKIYYFFNNIFPRSAGRLLRLRSKIPKKDSSSKYNFN